MHINQLLSPKAYSHCAVKLRQNFAKYCFIHFYVYYTHNVFCFYFLVAKIQRFFESCKLF